MLTLLPLLLTTIPLLRHLPPPLSVLRSLSIKMPSSSSELASLASYYGGELRQQQSRGGSFGSIAGSGAGSGTRLHSSSSSSSTSSSPPSSSSSPPLIDIDCNLLHPDLVQLYGTSLAVLDHPSTIAANVVGMLTPSSTLEEVGRNAALCAESPVQSSVQLLTTVGVHPYNALTPPPPSISSTIASLCAQHSPHVAAIGECGLDYTEGFPEREPQMAWFEGQVEAACVLGMPLFVHSR